MNIFSKRAFAIFSVSVLSFAVFGTAHANEAMREQAAENFMQADANEDGGLTLDEFTTLINLNADHDIGRAKVVKRLGRYEMAFERMDGDADGIVTPEEISARANQRN